jgi:hypothetical protein
MGVLGAVQQLRNYFHNGLLIEGSLFDLVEEVVYVDLAKR